MRDQWHQFIEQHSITRPPNPDGWFCDLSSWSILNVQEGDCSRFLQGQLTCDLNNITEQRSALGACCSPKGRMLSNFRILAAEQGFWLIMNRQLIESNIAALNKYAVFFRTKLSNEENTLCGIGIVGEQGVAALTKAGATLPSKNHVSEFRDGKLLCVDDQTPRFQAWLPYEQAKTLWLELNTQLNAAPPESWELGDIRQGIAWVNADNQEQYTPHQFNLQALGGISFKKGCYTGQEIVARMQHLGKLKNRLYRVHCDSIPNELPAQVLNNAGKAVGELIACRTDHQSKMSEALIVVRNDEAEKNQLHCEQAGNLDVVDLPYAITNREHLDSID